MLDAEARGLDECVPELKKQLKAATDVFCKQILTAAHEQLVELCQPLIPAIQLLAAINALMPGQKLANDWLDCAKLISPVGYYADHLSGHVRVVGTNLLAIDDPSPALPEGITTVLQELNAASKALAQHRKYQPPKVLTAAEQAELKRREEWQRNEEAEQRAWDEEQARRRKMFEAGTLPRSPNVNHHVLVREPGTPAPRSERNVNATADFDGSISDEWRRIGALAPDSSNGGA